MSSLLSVTDLHVRYVEFGREAVRAVNGVSCEVRPGEILAILGESGCGKSTFAKSLLGMLPKTAVVHGSIKFAGLSLLTLSDDELKDIRGARMARIPQEPGLALNPVIKVGDQIAEVLRAHRSCSWKECKTEATKLLDQVQLIESSRDMYDAFPHQLSGGQQQRVAIAQSIACGPALIIADEPTTALDPATEMDILRLLKNLKAQWNMSLILITHNPMILPGFADRVAVMYGGRIVEEGSLDGVFHTPRHPYTQALLECARLAPAATGERTRFPQIPGSAPDAGAAPPGCVFAPRCSQRAVRCDTEQPQMIQAPDERRVECFLYV